jgi:tryptophan synthase alpha chain
MYSMLQGCKGKNYNVPEKDRLMNRIDQMFQRLHARGEKAVIPYIMSGDPSLERTAELVIELERSGADLIELGVPFSDPIADGPVIQRASARSLKSKTSLKDVLALVSDLRQRHQVRIPIILMTYYNPVLKFGEERFVKEASAAGVDGLIFPDLPPEEASGILDPARRSGLALIFLLAPTSTPERIKKAASVSAGFLYYVSLTGITGAKLQEVGSIEKQVKRIRRTSPLPVAVGFGISSPGQASAVARSADGVIVGSAIVRIIEQRGEYPDLPSIVGKFVRELKKAVENER